MSRSIFFYSSTLCWIHSAVNSYHPAPVTISFLERDLEIKTILTMSMSFELVLDPYCVSSAAEGSLITVNLSCLLLTLTLTHKQALTEYFNHLFVTLMLLYLPIRILTWRLKTALKQSGQTYKHCQLCMIFFFMYLIPYCYPFNTGFKNYYTSSLKEILSYSPPSTLFRLKIQKKSHSISYKMYITTKPGWYTVLKAAFSGIPSSVHATMILM